MNPRNFPPCELAGGQLPADASVACRALCTAASSMRSGRLSSASPGRIWDSSTSHDASDASAIVGYGASPPM
eukprot:CAMPEP_0181330536 /NCGR_PEP_ID=MMETSP1101-20121128/23956_1 /TAXON_ID=46948 /ORGANISM="Rhodomonas abbreviata, Strain Caron Lab Isolate" /LENGTH=71 /DNA_ID=CAMNT_0023439807 /DNA_START=160 /DNA_END=375 /DNA_ORIENTATION=+